MPSPPPSGVYVPSPTFFAPPGSSAYSSAPHAAPLDLDTQLVHSLHLARAGVKGLVLLGSTGEAVHITRPERAQILKHVRAGLEKEGFKDYPIIAGTATNSVVETVELLQDAHGAGAGWGLVLSPGYFAGNLGAAGEDGLKAWFTAVADASPIPIMIYHYPGVTNGLKLSPATLLALAGHANIVGCKLSHIDLSAHTQLAAHPALPPSFSVFTGLGAQLLPALAVGVVGTIDGLAAVFPASVVRIYDLFQAGKIEEARKIQWAVSSAEDLIIKWGSVGAKEVIGRVGIGGKKVEGKDLGRLPLTSGWSEAEWKLWEEKVKVMEGVEKEAWAAKKA